MVCNKEGLKFRKAAWKFLKVKKTELLKAGDCLFQSLDKPSHFLFRIVEGKGCPSGGGDTEVLHQGLAAMVTRSNGDALGIQKGGYIMRVDAVYCEGNYGGLAGCTSMDRKARKSFQPVCSLL